MSKEEIVNAILNTPDNHLDAIGKAILTEKGKRGNGQPGNEINKEEVLIREVGAEVEKVVERVVQGEAEEEVQHEMEKDAGEKGNKEVVVAPNEVVLRTRPSKKVGSVRRQKKREKKKHVVKGLVRSDCPRKEKCRSFPVLPNPSAN